MRDLEAEVGARLMERHARGVALTPAGHVCLDHVRLALAQIEVACEAARRCEVLRKQGFVIGFLLGQEAVWLREALRTLREEECDVEITLVTKSSPELANALMRGELDVALLRHEALTAGLVSKHLVKERLVVILPKHHRLVARKSVRPQDSRPRRSSARHGSRRC